MPGTASRCQHGPLASSTLATPLWREQSTLTQHVLKDLAQSLHVLQNEGMPLAILLGPQLIQFSPVHIQVAHANGIDI